jgi:hypothetical protein
MIEQLNIHYKNQPAKIPVDVWARVTSEEIAQSSIPDISQRSIPDGFTEEEWSLYGVGHEHSYFEDWPHPPSISTVFCSGSKVNNKDHAAKLVLSILKWAPPGESEDKKRIKGIGMWVKDVSIQLTSYISSEILPESVTFGEMSIPVYVAPATGMCEECATAIRA